MRLKVEAGKKTPEAIRETARQFEAIFVQSMLKAMRDASPGEGMGESNQTEFYRDMHDQQLALHMVKGRGLGIADMLVTSLGGDVDVGEKQPEPASESPGLLQSVRAMFGTGQVRPLISESGTGPIVPLDDTDSVQALFKPSATAGIKVTGADTADTDWQPQTPQDFIRELLPHARKGAEELGVHPRVLIAQAALETGWGQKVIHHADGRSSFNLFGIKADTSWSGDKVSVATLEYENGIAEKRRAAFRSYDSLGSAVSGYVEFLRSNPRYQTALEQAADPKAYLTELKAAGYATDPAYIDKITAIMNGSAFGEVI